MANGLRDANEVTIDIHPDGKVSTPWLTIEGERILKSVGKEPKEFEKISNYCG